MTFRRWGIRVGRLHIIWLDMWARAQWYGEAKKPWWRGLGLWFEWGKL